MFPATYPYCASEKDVAFLGDEITPGLVQGKGLYGDGGCRSSEMFCSQVVEQLKVSRHILQDLVFA